MKNVVKLSLISFLVSSCGERTVIHSYDVKRQLFNRYEVEKVNKNSCSLDLKSLSPIDSDDPNLDGLVCVTRKQYSRLQADAISECENAKNNITNP